jgi:hypothetical protein
MDFTTSELLNSGRTQRNEAGEQMLGKKNFPKPVIAGRANAQH